MQTLLPRLAGLLPAVLNPLLGAYIYSRCHCDPANLRLEKRGLVPHSRTDVSDPEQDSLLRPSNSLESLQSMTPTLTSNVCEGVYPTRERTLQPSESPFTDQSKTPKKDPYAVLQKSIRAYANAKKAADDYTKETGWLRTVPLSGPSGTQPLPAPIDLAHKMADDMSATMSGMGHSLRESGLVDLVDTMDLDAEVKTKVQEKFKQVARNWLK